VESFADRYDSTAVLASSALAEVRRARDRATGRDVVIKVSVAADDGFAGRTAAGGGVHATLFHATLFHPNIATPIDSGTLPDGRMFVVFPFVSGMTLRALLDRDGRLEPDLAVGLLTEVLDALAAVHRAGVVHRDVKPENIMVACSGVQRHAVLLDFGFADMAQGVLAGWEDRRELLGTPRYAAPEQLRGEQAAPAADVYSWGLTLLECLTGRQAIPGASAREAVAHQLGSEPVAIPEEWVHAPLGRLLARVTSKDPACRPASAVEALDLLSRVLPRAVGLRESREAQDRATSRQVTVLSARLVNDEASDGASNEERLHEFREVAALLSRNRGCVVSATGRRVVAVFGLRDAEAGHTDAALDAAWALLGRPDSAALSSRPMTWAVGMHTDIAVTAPLPCGLDEPEFLVGDAVDVATRLDEAARPGRTVVSGAVEAIARQRWSTVHEGNIGVPGVKEPVALWRLRGRKPTVAAAPSDGTFVGRVGETAVVREAWEAVRSGSPRVLFVRGPAGIGKSALVRVAREIAVGADWHVAGCAVEQQSVPMHTIAQLARSVVSTVSPLTSRGSVVSAEHVPLLVGMLGEPVPPGFTLPPDTPERLRERTAQAAVHLLLGVASEGPTALVIEDLHWADASTSAFVDRLVAEVVAHAASGSPLPLLLLLTTRPGYQAQWDAVGIEAVARRIELGAMSASETEELVRVAVGSGTAVAGDRVASLVAASGGVPLFVEQAARLIVSRTDAPQGEMSAAIPTSISSVLAARLAMLAPAAAAAAGVAAAVGVEFDADLVGAVMQLRRSDVPSALDELVNSGMVRAGDAAGSYAFSHALVRDAAYLSLPSENRPDVHRRIATVLVRDRPDVASRRPAEVALHYELAGDFVAAAELWHRSGVAALAGAAYPEACRDLERGERLLDGLPGSPDLLRRRLGLATALSSAHIAQLGFGATEAREAFVRARRLGDELGEDIPLEVLGGIFGAALVTADDEELEAVLPRFRELAQRTDDPLRSFSGHQVLAVTACWRACLDQAYEHASTAVDLYRREAVRSVSWEFGFGIHSYAYLMITQFHRGFADNAEAVRLEMLERAVRQRSPHFLAPALGWSTTLTHDTGRPAETLELASRLASLSQEQHLYLWNGYAMLARGSALADLGDSREAVESVRAGLDVMDAVGVRCGTAYYTAYLVKALLAAGEPEAALEAVRKGMEVNAALWTRLHESETIRLHGVVLDRLGRVDEAAGEYRRAHTMAVRDGALAIALRALTDLVARSPQDAATAVVVTELAATLDAIGDGHASADVRRARQVLAAAKTRAA